VPGLENPKFSVGCLLWGFLPFFVGKSSIRFFSYLEWGRLASFSGALT